MASDELPHPPVVAREEWLVQRRALLEREKALTRQRDQISAQRRRLPMVRIEKEYVFEGPDGVVTLPDLFEGRRQLIVYHFMFAPDWDEGCPGCTGFVYSQGNPHLLRERDTNFVLVSRAPLAKLQAYKAQHGWSLPWYSSLGSDFNYDFHVTHDAAKAPLEYNFRSQAEIERPLSGEDHGLSVFFRTDDALFHTYSTYARGVEGLNDAFSLLDVTPYGRQEDWEDSPAGWPQKPTYGE